MSMPKRLLWVAVAVLGAVALGIVALKRGEPVNAMWLVIAALCIYAIAYRFYGLFIANRVLGANAARQTPAYRHNDGLDYVPTNGYVLFGHHFPRSPAPDRWWDRCSPPRWATSPVRWGCSPVWYSRAPCRT